jgi:hypothetical protein
MQAFFIPLRSQSIRDSYSGCGLNRSFLCNSLASAVKALGGNRIPQWPVDVS